ncbi:MAG: caspase family protein, partial [Kofleriaceae bacterium]
MGEQHVLLVGIDAYDGGGSLTGCVNDIDEVQDLLTEHVGIAPDRISRLASPVRRPGDRVPTLDAIRQELERLAHVAPGDRVLIHYSGHGTQCIVAGSDGKRFSREALLPKDKVSGPRRRYLFDWQLNELIGKIVDRTPRVTVILDCCSSAGVTRDLSPPGHSADRFHPSNEVYQLRADDRWTEPQLRGITSSLGVVARVQLIAACRDDERAREIVPAQGAPFGLLTRAWVTAIKQVPRDELERLRWGRIWRPTERDVRARNPRQNPYISGGFGRHVFGFGGDDDADCGYAIVAVPGGYQLDVGRLHGVTANAEIAVYPELPLQFPRVGSPEDAPVGRLRVREPVGAATAFAEPIAPFALPASARGRLVRAGEDARLQVRLVPYEPDLAAQIDGSDLLSVTDRDDAEVELVQRGDTWIITDDVHGYGETAIVPELVAITQSRRSLVRAALEHYHAYSAPLRLARACRDLPNLLQLTVLDCTSWSGTPQAAQDPKLPLVEGGVRASYEVSPATRVCFAVDNASELSLWVTLINCATSGRVQVLGEQEIPPHARRIFWAEDRLGEPWTFSLPDERPAGVDRLIAIGSTDRRASLQHLRHSMSFEEVLNPRRQWRSGPELRVPLPVEQWTAAMTTLRITAPVGRPQSDLWIYLRGTPDAFTSAAVPLAGTPISLQHRLALSATDLEIATPGELRHGAASPLDPEIGDASRRIGVALFTALFVGELGEALRQHRRSAHFV